MSAAQNGLLALRNAAAAYQRHVNALAGQIATQERYLKAWPPDLSDARHDAVALLRERRAELAEVRQMLAAIQTLAWRGEVLCVKLEEAV